LTALLLPVLEKTPGSRIVAVSSVTHALPGFDVEDLMFEKPNREYGMFTAYAYCKLCNLLFAFELAERLKESGSSVMSVACHPGFTDTPIQGWVTQLFSALSMSSEAGALSLIYAAIDPSVVSGQYIGPDGFLGVRGMPTVAKASAQAMDTKLQARLWQLSEELTAVKYSFATKRSSKRASSKRASKGKSRAAKSDDPSTARVSTSDKGEAKQVSRKRTSKRGSSRV
jgi:NAD(P)-dependent dehydrogenase (short-subunit alcohol dehydrogenase family)